MTTCRSALRLLTLLGGLFCLGVATAAAEPPKFAGRVLDTLGNGIPRVEVLVLDRAAPAATPLAAALSDGDGYFSFASLLPGAYRIAALKDGYLTFVGVVDTAARRSMQLVLQPSAGLSETPDGALPEDASWALRLPRRSILRETDPALPGAIEAVSDASRDGLVDSARLEVDQTFGVSPSSGASSSIGSLESRDTRLRVALPLGERGSVALRGSSESHQAIGARDSSANRADRAMHVGVRFEAVPGGQLDVNAFYESHDFRLASTAGDLAGDGMRQQQGSLGYDARWTQRIDERSEFDFGVDYTDIWLETPSAAVAGGRASGGLGSRVIGAQGAYRRQIGARHELSFTLRARLLEWPEISGIADGPIGGRSRRPDLDVAFDAEERWSLGGPWVVVYGLGHRESLMDDGLRVTEPRLGGSWDSGGWRVSATLSYHDVGGEPDAPAAYARSSVIDRRGGRAREVYRPRNDVGYDASLEVPVASGLSLHGRVRSSPVEFAHVRFDGPISSNPIYLSEGAAAVRERTVTLIQSSGRSRTSVELSSGEAEGQLSAFVPFAEADESGPREVAFDSARLGLRLPISGTDLALEYRRLVSESSQVQGASDAATLRSLEMRVRQSLWDMTSSGDWRLLVAVSLDSFDTDDLDRWSSDAARADEPRDGLDALDAMNRRISAGVSVAF